MDDAAAFSATLIDVKLIRTRQCVQFVFEEDVTKLPPNILERLGGIAALASGKIHCGIARLNIRGTGEDRGDSLKSGRHALITTTQDSAPGPVTKTTPARSPSSQDGYKLLCMERSGGWPFMDQHRGRYFVSEYTGPIDTPERAKMVLRDWIGCKESLSEVDDDPKLAGVLDNILGLFEGWKRGYDKAS